MVNKLEKIKMHRSILNLMKEEEKYHKKRSIVCAQELLDITCERFILMQEVLKPLYDALSSQINVKNMFFGKDYDDTVSIFVEYEEDRTKKFFVIPEYSLGKSTVISYDSHFKRHDVLVKENIKKVLNAFKDNDNYRFEEEFILPTASKRFVIKNTSNEFGITDNINSKYLNILFEYVKDNDKMEVTRNVSCFYPTLLDCLQIDVNLYNLLKNMKVYEESVPKVLIKK